VNANAGLPLRPTLPERLLAEGTPMLWGRWLFLRALGVVFFSVFYSLAFQIHGLIGPRGILPAADLLGQLAVARGPVARLWLAPTFLWLGAGDGALTTLVALGVVASLLLVANLWPRGAVVACGLLFLSFIAVAQDFAMYQSDGMLLEAAFASFFLAPRGVRPMLGAYAPPTRAAVFLLRWEWFRIYFESGVVKLASHDPQWAHLTAMDHYYENGPLPTWVAWYAQQRLPHGFHAFSVVLMFVVELGVAWLAWAGRRARLVAFAIVTPFQIGIILTANYAFLNYLVLLLGLLLVDDEAFARVRLRVPSPLPTAIPPPPWRILSAAVCVSWVVYGTVLAFLRVPNDVLLGYPVAFLEPFRVANAYGLFAVMTDARYEIELQGTTDGEHWVAYPFRYKPQDPREAPGIYAPYQPRFEWNLWFASLGSWRGNQWVMDTELRLMQQEPSVLRLFRDDPLQGAAPIKVRAVLWRYWFSTPEEKRTRGAWWDREELGEYAPSLERKSDGTIGVVPAEP
jgi:hypothetical protein